MATPSGTVDATRPRALVIPARRLPALLGALAWIAVAVIYYGSLLALGPNVGRAPSVPMASASLGYVIVLWVFPVLIVPHLIGALRALVRPRRIVFDADAGVIERDGRRVAFFDDLRRLELRPVNGGCEEFTLFAVLNDGTELCLESGARRPVAALGGELAAFLGVEVESAT